MVDRYFDETNFHTELLQLYSHVLEQICLLNPQDKIIDATGVKLMQNPSIPEKDKELHLALLTHINRINEELQAHYWMSEHLKILHEFGNVLTSTLSKEDIFYKAFELVGRVMDADAFFIALYDANSNEVYFPFLIEHGSRYDPLTLTYGQGIVSTVLSSREILHLRTSEEFDTLKPIDIGSDEVAINSSIYIPLMLGDQVKGVISAQSTHQFTYKNEHVELLRIIGNQVINAIENSRHYELMYERSIRDELTNLFNRRAFNKDLFEQVQIAKQNDGSVVLVMLDSDNLKAVNDLYGHHIGDIHIKHVAKAIQTHCSTGEKAYRYAGDEFMILLSDNSIDSALEKVASIQQFLQDNPIELLGNNLYVTVSVGIASYPEHANSADELTMFADEALYYSKESGKNGVNVCLKKDSPS